MRRSFIYPLFVVGCLLWGCGDTPELSTADWKVTNHRDDFSIKTPSTWKAFPLEKTADVEAAKAYARDKPSLKKILDQIITVNEVRFVALNDEGFGMNVTRSNNQFEKLTVEELKDKIVANSRESFPWVGLPEAGIADLPAGKAVLIQGTFPQAVGEDQHIEQYTFALNRYLYTVSFITVKSKESKMAPFVRPILSTFAVTK